MISTFLTSIRREDDGVLTFEWILAITVLTIGVVGGYSAVRDGLVDELGDVGDAIISVDQSFTTEAPEDCPNLSWGSYTDTSCDADNNGEPDPMTRTRPTTPPISQ